MLTDKGITTAWTAKAHGAARLVERLWSSVKCEESYLHVYDSVGDAKASIAGTWNSTMDDAYIRALTTRRLIKPTSPRCRSARQPAPAEAPLNRRGIFVQTTGTTFNHPARKLAIASTVFQPPQQEESATARRNNSYTC